MSHAASSGTTNVTKYFDPWYQYGYPATTCKSSSKTDRVLWVYGWQLAASTNNPRLYEVGYPPGFRHHAAYINNKRWERGFDANFGSIHWKYRNLYCYRYFSNPFTARYTWKWMFPAYGPPCVSNATEQQYWLQRTRNRALVKLKDRNMNLGETLGEWKETYLMVRNAILEVVKIAKLIKRGDWRTAWGRRPRVDDFTSLWLQARYGWRPFLEDAFAVSTAWDRLCNGRYDRVWLYVVKNDKRESHDSYEEVYLPPKLNDLQLSERRRGECSMRVKARYDYRCRTDTYFRLVDLGVMDPVLLAWELMPFSFVVDWFLRVSTFLEGWTAQSGLDYLDGSISQTVIAREFSTQREPVMLDGRSVIVEDSLTREEHLGTDQVWFRRWKESAPIPTLQVEADIIDKLLGYRLIDAIALLDSVLRPGKVPHLRGPGR